MKYWPEIGKCGYLVWRYLLRRDDLEPAPWTPEGLDRIKKLGLSVQVRLPVFPQYTQKNARRLLLVSHSPVCLQYPPGYLAAMANKTKKEACARPGRGGRSKHYPGRGRPRGGRRCKIKEKEENGEEEEEEQLIASVGDEEPQSNGEQKTTRGSGGCFYR